MASMRHPRLHASMLVALMLLSGLGTMAPSLLQDRTNVAMALDLGDVTDSHEFGGDTVSISGLVNAEVREEAVLDRWSTEVLESIEGNLVDGPHPVLSPMGLLHACWVLDNGSVHHGRLDAEGTWSSSRVTSVTGTNPVCALAVTTDDRARLLINDGSDLVAAREAFPNSMYLNQVWHLRTFIEGINAASISLALNDDREHAAVVDLDGRLWLVQSDGVRWSHELIDNGPVTGEVEVTVVDDAVEMYVVLQGNLLSLRLTESGIERSIIASDDGLQNMLGVDHDRAGLTQVATVVSDGSTVELQLIRSLVGQRQGRVAGTPMTTLVAGDDVVEGALVAGDLDDDGADDVVVSDPGSSTVTVHWGSSDGSTAASSIVGSAPGFGRALAVADFDGDGLTDLVVGHAGDDAGNGSLSLYRGGDRNITSSQATWTMVGSNGEALGTTLVAVPDLNGDGADELVVAGPAFVDGSVKGRVRFFFGNTSGTLELDRTITPLRNGPSFGRALAVGDLNCDGTPDLAVSNTGNLSSPSGYSSIEVYHGSASGYNGTPDRTMVSNIQGRLFGYSLAVLDDVNGDGCGELLVGEPLNGTSEYNGGRLMLWTGAPSLSSSPSWSMDGSSNERLGLSLTPAGDIDGDGRSDVLIGSAGGSSNPGQLELRFGADNGLSADGQVLRTGGLQQRAGFMAAAGLDTDGDGLEEIISSIRGAASGGAAWSLNLEVRERIDWETLSFPLDSVPRTLDLNTALRGETSILVVEDHDAFGNGTVATLFEHTLDGTPGGQWVRTVLVDEDESVPGPHVGVVADGVGRTSVLLKHRGNLSMVRPHGAVAFEMDLLTTGTFGEHLGTAVVGDAQHVVLASSGDSKLWHAFDTGSGWSTSMVRTGVDLEYDPQVTGLSNGTLMAVYRPVGTTQVEAAWYDGAAWSLSTIDLGGNVTSPALALGSVEDGFDLLAVVDDGTNTNLTLLSERSSGSTVSTLLQGVGTDATLLFLPATADGPSLMAYATSSDAALWMDNGSGAAEVEGFRPTGLSASSPPNLSAVQVPGIGPHLAVRWSSTQGALWTPNASTTNRSVHADVIGDGGAWDLGVLDDDLLLFTSTSGALRWHAWGRGVVEAFTTVPFGDRRADHTVMPVAVGDHLSLVLVDGPLNDVTMLHVASDSDRDLIPDSLDDLPDVGGQWEDTDGDGWGDLASGPFADQCPTTSGLSSLGRLGCGDSDNDGWDDETDDCPSTSGTSWFDRQGCEDNDQDGWSTKTGSMTIGDSFILNWKQSLDTDGDGYGDNNGPDCCSVPLDPNNVPDEFPDNALQYKDTDGDGWGDNTADLATGDQCVYDYGTSWRDRRGCPDADGDGASDPRPPEDFPYNWSVEEGADMWPSDPSQWADSDGDGYGDNGSTGATNPDRFPTLIGAAFDDDEDGVPDNWTAFYDENNASTHGGLSLDGCLGVWGNSSWGIEQVDGIDTVVPLYGCPDTDGDGRANMHDAFPADKTQQTDTDGDGFGDNIVGINGDECPYTPGVLEGTPTVAGGTGRGCPLVLTDDADGDGVYDDSDQCPSTTAGAQVDANGCADTQRDVDGDGVYDANDMCPGTTDPSTVDALGCDATQQQQDTDGDGVLDPSDACPNTTLDEEVDARGCAANQRDSDGDGIVDADDACPGTPTGQPVDATGCLDEAALEQDLDGDGFAGAPAWEEGPDGLRLNQSGDAFPLDPTQWNDTDGDGYGDEPGGNMPDACPEEAGTSLASLLYNIARFGCPDEDGDGWVDEPFPLDPTQWIDEDQDGFGDNASGASPDLCPGTQPAFRDLVNDAGCSPMQLDSDGDGIVDFSDLCPDEPMGADGFADGCPRATVDGDDDPLLILGQPIMVVAGGGIGAVVVLVLLVSVVGRLVRGREDDDDDEDGWEDDDDDEWSASTRPARSKTPSPARQPADRGPSSGPTKSPSSGPPGRGPFEPTRAGPPGGGPPGRALAAEPARGGPPGRSPAPSGPSRDGSPGGGPPGRSSGHAPSEHSRGGPPGGGPPGRAAPEPEAPKRASRKRVTVAPEDELGPTRRRAKVEVDLSMFEADQVSDRRAAVEWVTAELASGGAERTVLMQLQSTGWTAVQSRAIIDLARAAGRD